MVTAAVQAGGRPPGPSPVRVRLLTIPVGDFTDTEALLSLPNIGVITVHCFTVVGTRASWHYDNTSGESRGVFLTLTAGTTYFEITSNSGVGSKLLGLRLRASTADQLRRGRRSDGYDSVRGSRHRWRRPAVVLQLLCAGHDAERVPIFRRFLIRPGACSWLSTRTRGMSCPIWALTHYAHAMTSAAAVRGSHCCSEGTR